MAIDDKCDGSGMKIDDVDVCHKHDYNCKYIAKDRLPVLHETKYYLVCYKKQESPDDSKKYNNAKTKRGKR